MEIIPSVESDEKESIDTERQFAQSLNPVKPYVQERPVVNRSEPMNEEERRVWARKSVLIEESGRWFREIVNQAKYSQQIESIECNRDDSKADFVRHQLKSAIRQCSNYLSRSDDARNLSEAYFEFTDCDEPAIAVLLQILNDLGAYAEIVSQETSYIPSLNGAMSRVDESMTVPIFNTRVRLSVDDEYVEKLRLNQKTDEDARRAELLESLEDM